MKKKVLVSFFSVLFIVAMAFPVFADYNSDVTDGVKAYKSGNYSEAYRLFRSAYAVKPSKLLGQYVMAAYKKYKSSGDNLLEANGISSAYADWSTKQNLAAINPMFLMVGFISARYERMILPSLSAAVEAGYSFTGATIGVSSSNSSGSTKTDGSGFLVGGAVNWFPQARALNGWFIGPELDMYSMSYKFTTDDGMGGTWTVKDTESLLTMGAHGGYRWIFGGGFSLDASLALIMLTGQLKQESNDSFFNSTANVTGFLPTLGCNLGYAF